MTSTEARPDESPHGNGSHEGEASPYLELSREAWADLAHETVSPLMVATTLAVVACVAGARKFAR